MIYYYRVFLHFACVRACMRVVMGEETSAALVERLEDNLCKPVLSTHRAHSRD